MRTYKDKEELKAEISKGFEKYIAEFDSIPEALKDIRVAEGDRTPAENLAYQIGWTTLLLKWEDDEKHGIEVKTPSELFRWNQLGDLYQWFTDTYSHLSLVELKEQLKGNVTSIQTMIDSMSEEELFQPHMRKWADDATKTAVWEVYKFIHVNTVAPFGTFRTKIRKWKRQRCNYYSDCKRRCGMHMKSKYDEIMGLPHHVSKTRPQMPMSDRAAQFAPFAALTGYDSAIKETGRLTDERIELDEEALTALDMRYQLLMDAFDDAPEVTITYFQADERKAGGKYITATGAVKKVDDFERRITMQDGSKIPMDEVLSIDGELFSSLE